MLKHFSIKSILVIPIHILMLLAQQEPSMASFTICNKTNESIINVAIAYNKNVYDLRPSIRRNRETRQSNIAKVGYNPISRGWWQINRNNCITPLGNTLIGMDKIYYYAKSNSLTWNSTNGGQEEFCIDTYNAFNLSKVDCQIKESLRERISALERRNQPLPRNMIGQYQRMKNLKMVNFGVINLGRTRERHTTNLMN